MESVDDVLETEPCSNDQRKDLDIDDAFSDGDDHDFSYKFSPDAVREEFAKHCLDSEGEPNYPPENHLQDGHSPNPNGTYGMDDATPVSQMDSPVFESQTIDDESRAMSFSQFSIVTLSGSSRNAEDDPERLDEVQEGDQQTISDVVIDASEHSDNVIQVTQLPAHEDASQDGTPASADSTSPPPAHHDEPVHNPSSSANPSATPSDPGQAPITTADPSLHAGQRAMRVSGPSALEKVMSRTRPSFLPPKSREEDDKHLSVWRSMMKSSRTAEEKRQKALRERRLAREKKVEESLHLWEKEIVPDWHVVHRNPALRKLWWKGIPTKLRALTWERAVGNALALSKDSYRVCLARAKKAITRGTFPATASTLMEEDISNTLPTLRIFNPENGPMYEDLKDLLYAWVVARSDEGLGYKTGAAKIAAMLLLNMPSQRAFIVLRNLLERHCLRSFYGGTSAKDDVEAYHRIFDTLLADLMPKIYFNFKQHHISPAAYLPDWLVSLFLDHLPFEACARIWDVLLLEGDSFLFRAALGVLGVLETRLFFPDKRELLELLKGENKAALETARRNGWPLGDGRYSVYGIDEESLWERIDSMSEWWKETTWTRLIQRELPDL